MKLIDDFRDGDIGRALGLDIARRAAALGATAQAPLHLMEVCGGHTHALMRYGLPRLVGAGVRFVHGPGCPVCVLPRGKVDEAIAIAETPGVLFTCFGDALRAPGSTSSLGEAKSRGADVRAVYSPLDTLELARRNPNRRVVFFAIGFETTAPSTALTLMTAAARGVDNFSVFCCHVRIEPALRALLDGGAARIDAFIGPGHLSAVTGFDPYRFVAEEHGKPLVISGFEPIDLLQSTQMILSQLARGAATVENQYTRVVREEGSAPALAAMERAFVVRERFEWRGLGEVPRSGLAIAPEFASLDAERLFEVRRASGRRQSAEPKACACADILRGVCAPEDCKVFGTACTPSRPLGACMVSSEGACAAAYRYRASGAGGLA